MTGNNENARAGRPGGDTSRRRFLQGTTGAFGIALVSPGLYKMIDTIAKPPDRLAAADITTIQEQYILQGEQQGHSRDPGAGPVRRCHYCNAECAAEC